MSSPGQIAEPRMRPVSGMSASALPSPSGRNQPLKNFGQDYQFAETWANPPPEFVVGSGTGEEALQTDGVQENGGNAESSRESYPKEAAVWVPPPEAPWYKKITFMQWAVSIISTVGTAGVIIAILGAMGKLGPQPSVTPTATAANTSYVLTTTSALDASPTTSSSAILSSFTGTSTTLSLPTSTVVIKDCSNTSSFYNDIRWVGADSGYTPAYDDAHSAGDCCNRCFSGNAGCAGWLYNGTNDYTRCTKIILNAGHTGMDPKCPKGYSDVLSLSTGGNGIAGIGPCSQDISVS